MRSGFDRPMPPMVQKEMRSLMRGRRAPVILFISAAIAVGIGWGVPFLALQSGSGIDNYATVGRWLFGVLMLLEAVLAVALMSVLCAGAMLREYRQRTLESLLLTKLTPRGIVAGKLYVALGFLLVVLLAVLPVMATVFLLGGVSPWEVLAMHLLLVVFACCTGAAGLYMAARFPHSDGAIGLACLLALAWIVLPLPVLCIGLPVSSLVGLLVRLRRQGALPEHINPVIFLLLVVTGITAYLLVTGLHITLIILLIANPAAALLAQLFAGDFVSKWISAGGLVFFALVLAFGARLMFDRAVALVKRRQQETDALPFEMRSIEATTSSSLQERP